MTPQIESLNRKLGESLGRVCGGTLPRFAWKYAPDNPYFVYGSDNRTLIRRCWADAPAPGGGTMGKVWLLAEWRLNKTVDHFGYGEGIRVPVVQSVGYSPYFETALIPGQMPTEAITANYIRQIDWQLQMSAEFNPHSFDDLMADQKYSADKREKANRNDWLEMSREVYDDNVGAMGNCQPGTAGGFMSFGGV